MLFFQPVVRIWKKALEIFRKHERSHCHIEASTMSVNRETHEDIGEIFSDTLSQEKFEKRQILLKILEKVRFFVPARTTLKRQ